MKNTPLIIKSAMEIFISASLFFLSYQAAFGEAPYFLNENVQTMARPIALAVNGLHNLLGSIGSAAFFFGLGTIFIVMAYKNYFIINIQSSRKEIIK